MQKESSIGLNRKLNDAQERTQESHKENSIRTQRELKGESNKCEVRIHEKGNSVNRASEKRIARQGRTKALRTRYR